MRKRESFREEHRTRRRWIRRRPPSSWGTRKAGRKDGCVSSKEPACAFHPEITGPGCQLSPPRGDVLQPRLGLEAPGDGHPSIPSFHKPALSRHPSRLWTRLCAHRVQRPVLATEAHVVWLGGHVGARNSHGIRSCGNRGGEQLTVLGAGGTVQGFPRGGNP